MSKLGVAVCAHSSSAGGSSTGGGVETDESPNSWPAGVDKLKSSRLGKRIMFKNSKMKSN